jgi:hypothetical protein
MPFSASQKKKLIIGAVVAVAVLLLVVVVMNMTKSKEPKYLGCYLDSMDRILPIEESPYMEWTECKARAEKAKSKLFAIQDSNDGGKTGQCFHGNSLKRSELTNNCIKGAHMMGNDWSNAVYQL